MRIYLLINSLPSTSGYFSLNTNLANIVISNNVSCQIQANHKNILGKFILTATYNNVEYTKEISVVPLW